MRTERIDGTEYVIGSADHSMAQARAQMRADAAYLKAHVHFYERNLNHLRRCETLPERTRNDANATAFLARELVYVRAQVERTIYERTRIKEFVPVETNHPRGAQTYETQRLEEVGKAKIT